MCFNINQVPYNTTHIYKLCIMIHNTSAVTYKMCKMYGLLKKSILAYDYFNEAYLTMHQIEEI